MLATDVCEKAGVNRAMINDYALHLTDPIVSLAIVQTMIPMFLSMVMNGPFRDRLFPGALEEAADHQTSIVVGLSCRARAPAVDEVTEKGLSGRPYLSNISRK